MKKIALCIASADYQYLDKLPNAENDAIEMDEVLKKLGFETKLFVDLNANSIGQIYDEINKIEQEETSVFLLYYAGHGCQIEGDNYLLPIDFTDGASIGLQKRLGYPLSEIVNQLSKYKKLIKIIILDACRTDAISRGTGGTGFAPIYAPENTIIAFSTSPSQVAKERRDSNHGNYTSILLENITLPYVTIENMLKNVRKQTIALTNGSQVPWEHTSLIEEFYFNRNSFYDRFTYSPYSLADFYWKSLHLKPEIVTIIEILKSYDYYTQMDAFKYIHSLNFDNEYSIDELFVLGRNIYQSACGNLWASQEFIRMFDTYYAPIEMKIHILNGMAYEMYFDKMNKIRDRYKNVMLEEVMYLLGIPNYIESSRFISYYLENYSNRLLYLPGCRQMIKLSFVLEYDEDNGFYAVKNIFYRGDDIYLNWKDESLYLEKIDNIKSRFAKIFMSPLASIYIDYNIKIDNDSSILISSIPYFEKKDLD